MMSEGRLPNLSKLAAQGTFQALGTSMPPQSPVAWSNFITGLDAGGHGIYDFVHRDPNTMIPYLSTSRAEPSDRKLKVGKYQIPLGADKVELLRYGQPFWEVLEKRGIRRRSSACPPTSLPPGARPASCPAWGRPTSSVPTGSSPTTRPIPSPGPGKEVSGGKVYNVGLNEGRRQGHALRPHEPLPRRGAEDLGSTSPSTSTPTSRSRRSWWGARSGS